MVHKRSERSLRAIKLKEKIFKLIDEVTLDINSEIKSHEDGIGTEGTISQLKTMLSEIEKMKLFMNPKEFTPYYPIAIVDSWNYNSKLGLKLLDLAEKYKKL